MIGRAGLTRMEIEKGIKEPRCFGKFDPIQERTPFTIDFELGCTIAKHAWGCGFAAEASSTIRDHTFRQLDVNKLISVIVPNNIPSIRVAQKNGFRMKDYVWLLGRRLYRFVLTPEEWLDLRHR